MQCRSIFIQRIRGFQQVREKYTGEPATFHLRRAQQRCPRCGSAAAASAPLRRRGIRGESHGCYREVRIAFTVHRFYCLLKGRREGKIKKVVPAIGVEPTRP